MRPSLLTTEARQKRGEELTAKARPTVENMLTILRDRGVDEQGRPLFLGNRKGINAGIATHAVIYDQAAQIIYVSQGPALAGEFLGYDLPRSFSTREPQPVGRLPRDPELGDQLFFDLKATNMLISRAHQQIRKKRCQEGLDLLAKTHARLRAQTPYQFAYGDAMACLGQTEKARLSWQSALRLSPAYARETRELNRRLQR